MKLRYAAALGLVALAALLYGCGGAAYTEATSEDTATNSATDSTPPTISAIAPANDALSVAVNTPVTLTFSEPMDRTSVEGALALRGGAAVSGAFSWADDSTVVFTPSANLDYLTKYTITLSTAAKDKAGNALAGEYASSFTTKMEDSVLLLDGVTDSAKANDSVFPRNSNSSFTVEAWIYPTSNKSMVVVSDNAYDLDVLYDSGRLFAQFLIWDSACGSSYVDLRKSGITLDGWNHVVGIYNKDTSSFGVAINGSVFMQSGPFSGNFCNDLNFKFGIGNYNSVIGPVDHEFAGKINEVRVSNVARYTSDFVPPETFAPDANTIGLWRFDEAIGSTTFSDSSGNGRTLTAVGDAKTGK